MKTALIIGAGPAGLTAAHELLKTTDIKPIILEAGNCVGGIARTVLCNGNRLDVGGHRLFSKDESIMKWWLSFLPAQGSLPFDYKASGKVARVFEGGPDPDTANEVTLVRNRLSRILYQGKLFDYPVVLNANTIKGLGAIKILKILLSYAKARLGKRQAETNLEDFFINQFGNELYTTFFKSYTEKLWGAPCNEISSEWGPQRVKDITLGQIIKSAIKRTSESNSSIPIENAKISEVLYPKLGMGQLWEAIAKDVINLGTDIRFGHKVIGILNSSKEISQVVVENEGACDVLEADYVLSTMPIKELVAAMQSVPPEVSKIASELPYRDFITAGLLLNKATLGNRTQNKPSAVVSPYSADQWLYIQEECVKVNRIHLYNNWSPYLHKDPSKAWVGLEYCMNEGDELWEMPDRDFIDFAIGELEAINFANRADVCDAAIIRQPKAYPCYYGSYAEFHKVRAYLDDFKNLFLIGRNGMHKYNNMDHSVQTAREAVRCIREGSTDKSAIWEINTEKTYND